jgi:fucose permease
MLLLIRLRQPLQVTPSDDPPGKTSPLPPKTLPAVFWIFVAIVFLYGLFETVFGNWAILYLSKEKGVSVPISGFALASFWAMVTIGRGIVAVATVWISAKRIYCLLPFLILFAFLGIPEIKGEMQGVVVFGFAGLACSAFFPLSISFAGERFRQNAETVSGRLMAAYMIGYGFASFGVGRLKDLGLLSFSGIYTASSVYLFYL